MGTTFLANTYQTANTAPNVLFELVAAGVLTSVFVPTFVDYLVKEKREEGWAAANALTSVALVALVAISVILALTAPYLMRALTLGVEDDSLRVDQISLGARFLRFFAPQVVFYGAGMIMTGALHAHRRFVLPAVAPIFNNVVVIGAYLGYAAMRGDRPPTVDGITGGEVLLLGAGTTMGVVAMTVVLVPQLRRLGWRFRFTFDLRHPAVRRGARLGAWALGYAGGYQAGLIVVLVLANRVEGGVAAYQWAFTFFYLPHALFAVPIFNVLFTAMSEHAAREEGEGLVGRLRDGLSMLAFIFLPVSAFLFVAAQPLARLTLDYGVMTADGATLVGRVISAFVVGLPAYSAFLVVTRAFYAIGETKTPALVNAMTVVLSSIAGTLFFFSFSDEWSVAGLALGHSVAFAVGALVLGRALARRVGTIVDGDLLVAVGKSVLAGAAALGVMLLARAALPDDSRMENVVEMCAVAGGGVLAYVAGASLLGSRDLGRVTGLLGRSQS